MAQFSPKVAQKSIYMRQFYVKCANFRNSPKLLQNIWATYARNLVANNFQKSPNLFTLPFITLYVRLDIIVPLRIV